MICGKKAITNVSTKEKQRLYCNGMCYNMNECSVLLWAFEKVVAALVFIRQPVQTFSKAHVCL